ncbi:MAG: hypothetical protein GY788_19175 [bacterium]|nr:hypothetical protein [bacterium]
MSLFDDITITNRNDLPAPDRDRLGTGLRIAHGENVAVDIDDIRVLRETCRCHQQTQKGCCRQAHDIACSGHDDSSQLMGSAVSAFPVVF